MSEEPQAGRTPASEVAIDVALVRRLLQDQLPYLAELPIEAVGHGWDNAIFRLGTGYTVRFPRRQAAAQLIQNEQRWLPRLAPRLPIPVPTPLAVGQPAAGYPWNWSVLRWFEGASADQQPPGPGEARRIAKFLRALHRPGPEDAPSNPVRGVDLALRAPGLATHLDELERAGLLPGRIRGIWEAALGAPPATSRVWLHGDLHARNVLVKRGRVQAVIDWGDINCGDAATDLAAFWMLFDEPEERAAGMRSYGLTDGPLWIRAQGWAVLFGAILLNTGRIDHPAHAALGRSILRRLDETSAR